MSERRITVVAPVAAVAAVLLGVFIAWPAPVPPPAAPPPPPPPPAAAAPPTVDYVVDGDTLRLTDGTYVRLLGIDAPEAEGQDPAAEPAQCHAEQAALALTTITPPHTPVTLTTDPSQATVDRWGRRLAYVSTEHVPDAAEQLLRNGDVRFHVPADAAPLTRAGDYVLAQALAQRDRTGVWACP